ncbi:MAG: YraN family protein [Anaerolineae bacterium]|nr:YraN family protein [Anaerolineae bacterium]
MAEGWKQTLGRWGEAKAAEYLVQQGMAIRCRNYHCAEGEIDLVAEDTEGLYFVEVKTRSSTRWGYPEAAVDGRKREHILAAARHYLQEQELDCLWRVDVVAVVGSPRAKSEVEIVWYQNALD